MQHRANMVPTKHGRRSERHPQQEAHILRRRGRLIPTSYALAWTHHGCQYDDAQTPSITYRKHSMESAYSNAVNTAVGWWNNKTGSTTWFAATTSSDPNIDIYDGVYSWDGWAKVTGPAAGGVPILTWVTRSRCITTRLRWAV